MWISPDIKWRLCQWAQKIQIILEKAEKITEKEIIWVQHICELEYFAPEFYIITDIFVVKMDILKYILQ